MNNFFETARTWLGSQRNFAKKLLKFRTIQDISFFHTKKFFGEHFGFKFFVFKQFGMVFEESRPNRPQKQLPHQFLDLDRLIHRPVHLQNLGFGENLGSQKKIRRRRQRRTRKHLRWGSRHCREASRPARILGVLRALASPQPASQLRSVTARPRCPPAPQTVFKEFLLYDTACCFDWLQRHPGRGKN